MEGTTREFLEGVRDAPDLRDPQCVEKCCDALQAVGRGLAEAFRLHMDYEAMREAETDPEVRARLGEYEQKFKAMERTGKKLRDELSRYRRILRELDELDERLGAPLLEADAQREES